MSNVKTFVPKLSQVIELQNYLVSVRVSMTHGVRPDVNNNQLPLDMADRDLLWKYICETEGSRFDYFSK